jgi:hypothetical protein
MQAPTGPITLTQPLYDRTQQPIAAAAGSVMNFFQIPFGNPLVAGVNKTFRDTNLVQAGRLEQGNSHHITGISMHVADIAQGGARPIALDIRAIHAGCFRLVIGQVEYLKCPVSMIPCGGADLAGFSNIAAAVTEWQLGHGISANGNVFPLELPLDLSEQESLLAQITDIGIVAAPIDVYIVLWGQLTRPVR